MSGPSGQQGQGRHQGGGKNHEPVRTEPEREPGTGDGTVEGDAEYQRVLEDGTVLPPTTPPQNPGDGPQAPTFKEPPPRKR